VQRLGRALRRGDGEQRVRQGGTTTPRPPRGVGHGGRVGVHADGERVRVPGRKRQDMPAVAGSEVDRHAGVAACEALGLADVQLEQVAAADNSKHASILEGDAARIC
jgi:hypothetical protein